MFLFCLSCYSQTEVLLKVIDSDLSNEQKQRELDSLLLIGSKSFPLDTMADLYHNMGSKWYYKKWMDDYSKTTISKAIHFTEKAAELKRNKDSVDTGSLGQTLYNLAYFHYANDDFFQAIASNEELIGLGERTDYYLDANKELGKLYLTIGDFYKALDHFKETTHLYRNMDKLDSDDFMQLANLSLFTAETYAEMGYIEHSEEIKVNLMHADSALNRMDDAPLLYRSSIDQIEGNRLAENGNHTEAIRRFQKILADSTALDSENLAILYNGLGLSQIAVQDFDAALVNLNKALRFDSIYSSPYNNLGDLYTIKKDFEKGLHFYQKAIVYATDSKKEVEYMNLPDLETLELAAEKIKVLNHMVTKANAWLKYYQHDNDKEHLTHALRTFALADRLVDIIRSESTEYQSKLFWREKGASLYMKAVQVCYLLGKPEKAYYFMERNKALMLLEDVTNEQAKDIAQLPNSVVQREFELKQAIFLGENELQTSTGISVDTLASLKNRLYDHKRAYTEFADSLTITFPEYAKLKKKVDVLPYEDFESRYTAKNEAVLQYILNNEQGYGLLHSAGQSLFFPLDTTGRLNNNIIELYSQLIDMVTNREKLAAYNQLSHTVFQELIPKAAYKIIKDKNLTIVTDHTLQQIPFEAFVVDAATTKYLIEDTEIRYAYSISYLDAKKQMVGHPEKELIGLAPVQFASLGLPDLRFSGDEVDEAEKIYSGDVRLNGEATKTSLLKDIADYSIVHLSTHADVGEGGNPWIAFSDEKMYLNEIYAIKNQAEMVVLSACNTSIGELKKGEGAMSLARGFFHSGAKSVVSSLWSSNDKSSKELMVAFYKGLDKGLTKSAALRNAKLDYIDRYRGSTISPAYWSALIVIGDNAPISSTGSLYLWIFAIIAVIVLGLLYFVFKRKKVIP